jgi:hypothetical protein
VYHAHKNISKEEYYNRFIHIENSICVCGEKKKFRGFSEGYRKFCSVKCRSKNVPPTKYWQGKKQPDAIIQKRIKNTDQSEKEKTRKQTMLLQYGVDNPSKINTIKEKISKSNTGKKTPRKPNQQEKIIQSKAKNGTLKHAEETKRKISESVQKVYQSDDPPVTISENNHKNHKTGYFNGIFYRSSYELAFMTHCYKNGIEFISAENKDFRLKYIVNGKNHWYYPDFYLEKYDAVIEIKPNSMLTNEAVLNKINAGMQNYRFFVITEEELASLDNFFEELENEYLYLV